MDNTTNITTSCIDNLYPTFAQVKLQLDKIKELIKDEIIVVNTLPEEGVKNTLYLVPSTAVATDNLYDEYMWINEKWEKLGGVTVDLSNYATKAELKAINDKIDTANGLLEEIVNN